MPSPPPSPRPRAIVVWGLLIALQIGLCSLFLHPGETTEGVRLRLMTPGFGPESRLELLFERDMVPSPDVGRIKPVSPLRIDPPLAGDFVWLGPRQGVFTLTEAPRMDTTYSFRLDSGLRDARGRLAEARLFRSFRTPPFDVANIRAGFRNLADSPSRPVVHVAFNDYVSTTHLARFCEFRRSHQSVPARIIPLDRKTLPGHRVDGHPALESNRIPTPWSRERSLPDSVHQAVRIEPQERLSAGTDWQLVLKAGLPAHFSGSRLGQDRIIGIGAVTGLAVRDLSAMNHYDGSRTIVARLTTQPTGVSDDSVSILPQPEGLSVTSTYRALRINGNFQLGTDYQVTLRAGLTSRDGDRLFRPFTRTLRFKPLPPRVVLSGEDQIQYAGGNRRLSLLAYNTPSVHLRAKRLRPDALVHVLQGYRSRIGNRETERDYPFGLVPGETLPQQSLDTRSAVDQPAPAHIDLARIVGERGAVFLDLQPSNAGGSVGAQTVVQLTDLGLLWKRQADGWNAQVFSLRDAQPVARARVALLDGDGRTLAENRCDHQGHTPLPPHDQARWIVVATADDQLALPLHSGRLHPSGVPSTWRLPSSEDAKAMVFTDRPVYEPGDAVRFKGILRRLGSRLETPPAKTPVTVTLFDPRGSAVDRIDLVTSESGGFDGSFPAPDRHRGQHRLSIECPGVEESTGFLVQDHEPDAFELKLTGADKVAAGNDAVVQVSGRYLFGSPLSNARVRWSVNAVAEPFTAATLPGFVFGENVHLRSLERNREHHHAGGEAALGGDQPLTLRFTPPPSPHPLSCTFEVEATDLNQQTILQRRRVLVHGASFQLGLALPEALPRTGERPLIRLAAVDIGGRLLDQTAEATLRLHLVRRRSHRVAGTGGSIDYRTEIRLVEVTNQTVHLSAITELRLPPLPAPGDYLIELQAKDTAGRAMETRATFSVVGADAVVWDYRNAAELKMVSDRKVYQPGDVAELLLEAPFAGVAHVTLEREQVHYSFTTNVPAGAPVIRLPLRDEDAPNVFASITLIRGGRDSRRQHPMPEFRHGGAELEVRSPASRLAVAVTPERDTCRPGEGVTVVCEVRNHRGRPVRGAEVTLYAVDEGVLKLTNGGAPKPHDHFHATRPLAVRSHLSLSELRQEDPADLRFHNKGYVIGGGGRLPGLRQRFSAVPLWHPALHTDRRGRVTTTFTTPDNLTRYRIIAVVHRGSNHFGQGEATVVVDKPLMVEPVLPAFARVGDRIDCRALVVNRSGEDREIVVTRSPDNSTRRIRLAAGEAGTVAFPTRFSEAGEVEWSWTARFSDETTESPRDAVRATLAITEAMPRRREIALGRVSGSTNLLATIDMRLRGQNDAIAEVTLSGSPFLETLEGVNQLLHYPYGCVEQTSSSLLPWLLITRQPDLLNQIGRTVKESEIAVEAGIRRLFLMQTRDGGLSYWPGGEQSMFWGTAWAAFVLTHHAAPLPKPSWTNLLNHLRDRLHAVDLTRPEALDSSHALALAALARAGHPIPELHRSLHERRNSLDAGTRALIALAEGHSTRHIERARELLGPVQDQTDRGLFGSRQRRQAIEALAWRTIDPERAEALIQPLMESRRNGHWGTTQNNAWTLLALLEHRSASTGTAHGRLNDQEFTLVDGQPWRRRIDLRNDRVQLHCQTEQSAYARLEVSAPIPFDEPAVMDRGFRLRRSYEPLNESNILRVGAAVVVTLTLEVDRDSTYVAIDDPLPSLFEAIHPEFQSRGAAGDTPDTSWVSSHREMRRDRVLFFRDHLPAGHHVIRYLARVRASGSAIAPPAKVEGMYAPDRLGTTPAERVEAIP